MVLGRVGDDEVVLARSGDRFYAIGAHCTHYHGPLVVGLVVDDTVRCPLHHAPFRLRTGEALRARYAGQELQYLGVAVADSGALRPRTQETIDGEVQRIVGAQYERAQRLLQEHRPALASLTEQLLKSETLDGSVVRQAVEPSAIRAAAR